jgi:hypothetical protein
VPLVRIPAAAIGSARRRAGRQHGRRDVGFFADGVPPDLKALLDL